MGQIFWIYIGNYQISKIQTCKYLEFIFERSKYGGFIFRFAAKFHPVPQHPTMVPPPHCYCQCKVYRLYFDTAVSGACFRQIWNKILFWVVKCMGLTLCIIHTIKCGISTFKFDLIWYIFGNKRLRWWQHNTLQEWMNYKKNLCNPVCWFHRRATPSKYQMLT